MNPRQSVPHLAWIVLVVTLVALPILAWLQVGWTDEASRAQAYQMKQRVEAAGAQAGSTLEVERIVLREYVHNLRLPSRGPSVSPQDAVMEALRFWREKTRTPRILKGLWLVGTDQAWFLDATKQTWSAVDYALVPAPIRTLTKTMSIPGLEPDPALFSQAFFPPEPVRFSPFLLMVPEADLGAVVSDLVPVVLSQAFGGPQGLVDLSLTVRESTTGEVVCQLGPPPSPNSLPDLIRPLWGDGIPKRGTDPLSNPILRLWLHQTSLEGTSRWTLEVRHIRGTIEAISDQFRWTNLTVSLALLILLGAAFLLLFGLYGRSRRMVRSQKAFVASVSHELRTPLAVLRAAAENMKEGLVREPDQAIRYGTRMLEESDRLLQLTENVLAYSGIGSQRITLGEGSDAVSLDLAALAGRTVEAWEEAFHRAGAQIETRLPTEPLWVRGHPSALKAIVDNLLSNALRYGISGPGTVTVSVHRVEVPGTWGRRPVSRIRLEVKDQGPGIASRERKNVFEPFYQASARPGGIGLGLNLVQRIAIAHGAEARVAAHRGPGAVIQVDFPVEPHP